MQVQRQANPSPAVTSPVTGGGTRFVKELDAATIVARYAEQGFDVASYFDGMEKVAILQCEDTGYRFFYPPSLAGEDDFYEHLNRISTADSEDPSYRDWSDDYEYLFSRLVPGERLLDVGCGKGAFVKRAAEVCEATGIDGNSNAVARAVASGLDVRRGHTSDFRDEFAGRFDTVASFQVLEHIYAVAGFIEDLKQFIKPGGRIVIAVPNNEPYLRRFDPYNAMNCPPHHIGLWNLKSLDRLGQHFGLKIVDHAYCETSGRWHVEAYLQARLMLGLTTEIHEHGMKEKLAMLALAPLTVPQSLVRHVRTGGLGTRNVVAVSFECG